LTNWVLSMWPVFNFGDTIGMPFSSVSAAGGYTGACQGKQARNTFAPRVTYRNRSARQRAPARADETDTKGTFPLRRALKRRAGTNGDILHRSGMREADWPYLQCRNSRRQNQHMRSQSLSQIPRRPSREMEGHGLCGASPTPF